MAKKFVTICVLFIFLIFPTHSFAKTKKKTTKQQEASEQTTKQTADAGEKSKNESYDKEQNDKAEFYQLFSKWTEAFNHKDLTKTCALFSKGVTATYRGVPPRNYDSICLGFKKLFNEPKVYQYRFHIQDVYRSGDLAAVRVTWYLSLYEYERESVVTQDEGIDILVKNKKGEWEIVNYLAFPEKTTNIKY